MQKGDSMTNKTEKIGQPAFSTLVHSIASSALIAMGMVPEIKDKKNKELAEFNIELLSLLREKTNNNLTEEEKKLLDNCIQDLQVTFAQVMTKSNGSDESDSKNSKQ